MTPDRSPHRHTAHAAHSQNRLFVVHAHNTLPRCKQTRYRLFETWHRVLGSWLCIGARALASRDVATFSVLMPAVSTSSATASPPSCAQHTATLQASTRDTASLRRGTECCWDPELSQLVMSPPSPFSCPPAQLLQPVLRHLLLRRLQTARFGQLSNRHSATTTTWDLVPL